MMASSTLLVTGATGHTGRLFMRRLADAPDTGPVRAVARSAAAAASLEALPMQVEWRTGDLTDGATLHAACEDVDTILHIAGIHLSERLVAAATRAGVSWIIMVHTTGRFSRYKSAAADYARIEDGLLAQHNNLTILRPTMIYGSRRDRTMWRLIEFLARHHLFPVFGRGQNLMQPVFAPDLARAYHAVLTHRAATFGKQCDLPGVAPLRYIDLLRTVSAGLARRTVFVRLPLRLSVGLVALGNRLRPGRFPVTVEQVQRMNEDKAFDYSDAACDFGYAPLSFEEGIALEIDEFLRRP